MRVSDLRNITREHFVIRSHRETHVCVYVHVRSLKPAVGVG